eukprot:Nk52_evm51s239 gene=Nk52_evmTU51s239
MGRRRRGPDVDKGKNPLTKSQDGDLSSSRTNLLSPLGRASPVYRRKTSFEASNRSPQQRAGGRGGTSGEIDLDGEDSERLNKGTVQGSDVKARRLLGLEEQYVIDTDMFVDEEEDVEEKDAKKRRKDEQYGGMWWRKLISIRWLFLIVVVIQLFLVLSVNFYLVSNTSKMVGERVSNLNASVLTSNASQNVQIEGGPLYVSSSFFPPVVSYFMVDLKNDTSIALNLATYDRQLSKKMKGLFRRQKICYPDGSFALYGYDSSIMNTSAMYQYVNISASNTLYAAPINESCLQCVTEGCVQYRGCSVVEYTKQIALGEYDCRKDLWNQLYMTGSQSNLTIFSMEQPTGNVPRVLATMGRRIEQTTAQSVWKGVYAVEYERGHVFDAIPGLASLEDGIGYMISLVPEYLGCLLGSSYPVPQELFYGAQGRCVNSSSNSDLPDSYVNASGVTVPCPQCVQIRDTMQTILYKTGGYKGLLGDYQLMTQINGYSIIVQNFEIVSLNLSVITVYMVNQDEVVGHVEETLSATFYIDIALFVAAILISILVTHFFTGHLDTLTKQLGKIANLDFNDVTLIESSIKEVERISEALVYTRVSLRSFAKYVPSDVVKILLKEHSEATLGGVENVLTLMFADVRNITAISHTLSQDEFNEFLSIYLEEFSKVIYKYGGTIDKYMGSAVMTFWNSPDSISVHAILACKVALAWTRRLADLNVYWEFLNYPKNILPFSVEIGINTGECLVGNFGACDRFNFTALGDSVNLASRLQSLNKQYGTSILISEYTYEEVKHVFLCRPLNIVKVKGKDKGILVYEVLLEKDQDYARCRFAPGRRDGNFMVQGASIVSHDSNASSMKTHGSSSVCSGGSFRVVRSPADQTMLGIFIQMTEGYNQSFELMMKSREYEKALKGFQEYINWQGGTDYACLSHIQTCEHFMNNPEGDEIDLTISMSRK